MGWPLYKIEIKQIVMKIIPARKKDAQFIARSIVWAVGEELARKLAGNDHIPEDVQALFRELAERG